MTQIDRLLGIMKRLRDSENGCPWDKEWTFVTIIPYTLEETCEVPDAIQRRDFDDLRGELGDLLFQTVFYAQMMQEEERSNFDDTCAAISDKLERRYSHIFVDATAGNSSEVLARWGQIRSAGRARKARHSALDDVPHSPPALMRAHKIQHRCSAIGSDWASLGPVLDKVYEEIDEVMYEAQQAVVDEAKPGEEVGDLLFAAVNLPRHLGVKAEVALQKANRKFKRRFREIERIVAARSLKMTGINLDTIEEAQQETKHQETDLQRVFVIKRGLCDFINNKRLIYVRNISPRASILPFRYVIEAPCNLPLQAVRAATQMQLEERRGGEG